MLIGDHANQYAMIYVKTPKSKIPNFLESSFEEEVKVIEPCKAKIEGSEIQRVVMKPNEKRTLSVTFKNTGYREWPASTIFTLTNGLGENTSNSVFVGATFANKCKDIEFPVSAPSQPGDFI